jgi:hypothetical protein
MFGVFPKFYDADDHRINYLDENVMNNIVDYETIGKKPDPPKPEESKNKHNPITFVETMVDKPTPVITDNILLFIILVLIVYIMYMNNKMLTLIRLSQHRSDLD